MDDEQETNNSWREDALIKAYGSPANRRRRRTRYFKKLVAEHSEVLVRELLAELAKIPDFIPAFRLQKQDVYTAPLAELLQYAELCWFYIEKIEETTTSVTVYVWHGINMAASGECFTFSRTPAGLTLQRYHQYKIS